jgi:hypothetical protein
MPGGRGGRETKTETHPDLDSRDFLAPICVLAQHFCNLAPLTHIIHTGSRIDCRPPAAMRKSPQLRIAAMNVCVCVCVWERESARASERERLRDKQSTEGECFQNFSLLLQNLVLFLSSLRALTHFFTAAYHGSVTQCFSLPWKKTPRRTQGSEFGSMGIGASAWEGVVHLIPLILKNSSSCHNRMRMCVEIGVFKQM